MKIRKPGEVWLEGLGMVAKTRPVLIVSRADHDPRVLYLHVPLTSNYRGSDYEVPSGQLPFLQEPSFVKVQGVGSLTESRFIRFLGLNSDASLKAIRNI
jgi:mRNA interferase MazF